MGYDAFSPFAVAKVNVLCVPASRMPSEQFNEIFQSVKERPLVVLKDVNPALTNDALFAPSKFPEGSILFNFSKATNSPPVGSHHFEPNGRPQVVLGLAGRLETSERVQVGSSPSNLEEEGQTVDLDSLESSLMLQFGSQPHVLVCHLLVFHKDALSSNLKHTSIIRAAQGAGSAYQATVEVARLLIESIAQLAVSFKDQAIRTLPFINNSQLSRNPENRDMILRANSQAGSGVASPESRTPTPQPWKAEPETPIPSATGRYGVVLGMLSLQCACWPDAMRHLSEAIPILRRDYDHVWHARALECLLVCMLLFAWSGIEFKIPQVCHPPSDRSALRNTFKNSPTLDLANGSHLGQDTTPDVAPSVIALVQLIPKMIEMILELYGSASNFSGGEPQFLVREARIRLVNFLILLQDGNIVPEREKLNTVIVEKLPSPHDGGGNAIGISGFRKSDLAKFLIDSFDYSQSTEQFNQQVKILVAVTSSLSQLGQTRKHGFYLRDLLQRLGPAMIRARRVGASEMGMHPYASHLEQSDGQGDDSTDAKKGARVLLSLVSEVYGLTESFQRSEESIVDIQRRLEQWSSDHNSGDEWLKLEIIKLSIGVSEAIPDVPACLHFISQLLRCSKTAIMISNSRQTPLPLLSPEDQARYLDILNRISGAAGKAGVNESRADYWDDFLVRDVTVSEDSTQSLFTTHAPSEVALVGDVANEGLKDPFIFNPFSKPKLKNEMPILVAGELIKFQVILQNLLEIEIEVEQISLLAEGCDFTASSHAIVLSPLCAQTFVLTGTPGASGELKIRGCSVAIKNCRRRRFLIFREHWEPSTPIKLRSNSTRHSRLVKRPSEKRQSAIQSFHPPSPGSLISKVIQAQPQLVFHSIDVTESSLMLLEGQKGLFTLEIGNSSSDVTADFLLFTFQDNVTESLQEALLSRDVTSVETYEIQNQIQSKPVIRMKKEAGRATPDQLRPLQRASCTFEVYGRPGLMDAAVQVDYTFLGTSISQVKEKFYTRQLRCPIKITVNGSVEISRCNVVPMSTEFTWQAAHEKAALDQSADLSIEDTGNSYKATSGTTLFKNVDFGKETDEYCILSLDLRNVWPRPLDVELHAYNAPARDGDAENAQSKRFSVQETLQPGLISRVAFLIPRIFIADPYAPVPRLKSQRQFVVSGSNMSIETEAATREAFWFREELLDRLKGTWKEKGTLRSGEIDFRKGVRLSGRMVEALKAEGVEISFLLEESPEESMTEIDRLQHPPVNQVGKYHFILNTESFARLRIRVSNHSAESLRLLLRLQPALRNQVHAIALDLSKRFAWTGVLQQSLQPEIEPGGSREVELGVIALVEGDYEISASVEEIKGRRPAARVDNPEILSLGQERRIWHARKACLIDAIDRLAD